MANPDESRNSAAGYRKIISVINEHSSSTVTARYAMTLSTTDNARLILYAVMDVCHDDAIQRRTERHLEHLFDIATERGIPVRQIKETGPITRLLPKCVEAEGADLVFYPLAPGEHYGAPLQKHTIHQLLRTISSDLAIMRIVHMGRHHPACILAPLGATIANSGKHRQFLAALAHSFNAQVTLFHMAVAGGRSMPDDITRLRDELLKQNISVLERSGSGRISRAIAVEAITRHNDLIVLGASERSTLKRIFFGNPAGDVMHKPPCNAILFRSAAE